MSSDRDATEGCTICAEDFGPKRLRSLVKCGHDTVCSLCCLKIRALSRDRTCPFCNAECEHVVCSADATKTFDDYEVYGESCGPGFALDARSQMFFPKEYVYMYTCARMCVHVCIHAHEW